MQPSSVRRTVRPLLATAGVLLLLGAPARADDAAPAVATEKESTEATVDLHVTSPRGPVTILRDDTGEHVCTSPCDRRVPATARYRIGGERPSDAFVLDARSGTAKITVDAASRRGFWTGALTLGAAGALVGSGALALGLGYASQSAVPGADGTLTDTTYSDTMLVGTVLVVAGVAAGIWGGATLASNLKSRVSGNVVKTPPTRGNAAPLRTAAAPPWSAGPAVYVPLLGGVF